MTPIASADAARTAYVQLPLMQRRLLSRLQAHTTTVAEFAVESGLSTSEVRAELRAAMHALAAAQAPIALTSVDSPVSGIAGAVAAG